MMKQKLISLICLLMGVAAWGQTRYDLTHICREALDRGVVAVRQADGQVFISWRILESDRKGEPFDVWRLTAAERQQGLSGTKLNDQPLTKGGSFFIDKAPLAEDVIYKVVGGSAEGEFTLKADAANDYLTVPLQKPADGVTPDGRKFTYSANDASVGDVDGDGQYELILKWDPSNSHDNAHDGFTGPTLFDCYRLSGERLWRIDLGRNIRSGAHYVQFIVYDLDGDGRAEVMMKTADGTVDGRGNVIGDSTADYRFGVKEAIARQNRTPEEKEKEREKMRKEWEKFQQTGQRPQQADGQRRRPRWPGAGQPKEGRILEGPEYLTVFNGLTGEAMATVSYVPERGKLKNWGDENGNRSERYLAGVGYFGHEHNGKHVASAIFCRGYYTRAVIAVWDWDGKQLTNRWTFDTDTPEWRSYAGQGNHNLRVGDVDGDGLDEITYGAAAIDHDGRGLYNTRMGHGDAIHQTVFDASTGKLMVWDCHENRRDGSDYRDAATGEVIFQIPSKSDVGRAMAADIDPTNPGLEMWSSDSHGIRNIKGEVVGQAKDADDPQHNNQVQMNGRWLSVNFGIWWDGDLLRELLDRQTVSKYDWVNRQVVDVKKFDGQFNNGTKSNPCLSADILGDWREEVVIRNRESSELRIYTTTIPTDYRINCLMLDIPYRHSVAAENVAYNQPPETGFYLGPDNTDYVK